MGKTRMRAPSTGGGVGAPSLAAPDPSAYSMADDMSGYTAVGYTSNFEDTVEEEDEGLGDMLDAFAATDVEDDGDLLPEGTYMTAGYGDDASADLPEGAYMTDGYGPDADLSAGEDVDADDEAEALALEPEDERYKFHSGSTSHRPHVTHAPSDGFSRPGRSIRARRCHTIRTANNSDEHTTKVTRNGSIGAP